MPLDTLRDAARPRFAGPLLAQFEGLNTCSPISNESPLAGDTGSGMATVELQENCETAFSVEIWDVLVGMYDLYMNGVYDDGAPVATINAEDDGSGEVTGFVRFDPTPYGGELPLDFAVGIGSRVEVFNAEANPTDDPPALLGMLVD